MSKNKLFDDDSEEEVALKTENEYAKKYDAWREKEEIHKLEQKYGSKTLNPDAPSSDSEDESDEPPEVSEEMETQFLKTLALLKTKDPRIYDASYKFFDEKDDKHTETKIESETKPKTITFADSDDDDDDDNDDPNIFRIEKKAEVDKIEPDITNKDSDKISKAGKLKDFLTGKAEHIENEVDKDLEPLKAFWSDPKLNEGEAFLRDYILDKRYMEDGDAVEDKLRDDVELEADEKLVEEQGKFERAYNFRFEEPDDEYLKRYPRTMNSIRPKDDTRARKRAKVRTRKEEEKTKKMEEIARLKALKLKEVQEKIARIKQVTGNEQLAFKDEDIEGDFDPEEHDKRMKAIFDETYYGDADEQKPVFPDLDEELEIENWANYEDNQFREQNDDDDVAPHCEDDDFNMDADYDPKKARENLLEELKRNMGKKRRNRKRKTKLGQLLSTERPTFVPDLDKTYSEFMEEYYKMDCEDVIGGDLPTRFKYREVVPNDFGLSIEEILLADDKELTQWVPLKKIVKHRPANVEKSEVNTYKQKAADVNLKKKMLPSLFKDLSDEPDVVIPVEDRKKKKRQKEKKNQNQMELNKNTEETEQATGIEVEKISGAHETSKSKKKKNRKGTDDEIKEHRDDDKRNSSNSNNGAIDMNRNETTKASEEHNKRKLINSESSSGIYDDNTTIPPTRKKKKYSGAFVVETIGVVEPSQAVDVTSTMNEATKTSAFKKRHVSKSCGNDIENNRTIKKQKKKSNTTMSTQNELLTARNKNEKHKLNISLCKKIINKDFKKKFKPKDKLKQGTDKPTHPFSNLSDERLKAYGLNPKKYKNFLKYKKF